MRLKGFDPWKSGDPGGDLARAATSFRLALAAARKELAAAGFDRRARHGPLAAVPLRDVLRIARQRNAGRRFRERVSRPRPHAARREIRPRPVSARSTNRAHAPPAADSDPDPPPPPAPAGFFTLLPELLSPSYEPDPHGHFAGGVR